MTDPRTTATHFRRATALLAHYTRDDAAGVLAIINETKDSEDSFGLLLALLTTIDHMFPILRTNQGRAHLNQRALNFSEQENQP